MAGPLIKLFIATQYHRVCPRINNYYDSTCLISAIAHGIFIRDRLNFTLTRQLAASTSVATNIRISGKSLLRNGYERVIYWQNNSTAILLSVIFPQNNYCIFQSYTAERIESLFL